MTANVMTNAATPSVKMLTYNIWFSDHALARRMRAIGDIIAQHVPHVVALQEVTEEHWGALTQHPAAAAYDWTAPPTGQSYYTMLGVRTEWASLGTDVNRRRFKAGYMGRDLLSAVVQPGDMPPLIVGTCHLESLTMVRARSEQVAQATGWLAAAKNAKTVDVILCGDTNMATGRLKGEGVTELVRLPSGWRDAWESCGAGDGFTFDAERNRMVQRLDGWARVNAARLRYDRFWTRLKRYKCEHIELVGTEPIVDGEISDGDDEAWWPSDHFGVLLTLSLVSSGAASEAKKCVVS